MRFLLPYAERVLVVACNLSDSQAIAIKELIAQRDPPEDDVIKNVANKIGVSEDTAYELVHYLFHISRINKSEDLTIEAVEKDLKNAVNEFEMTGVLDVGKSTRTLVGMLVYPQHLVLERKKRRIQAGLGNEIEDVTSIVDIRPVFDGDRKNVKGWVPGATLRIEYRKPSGKSEALLLEVTDDSYPKLHKELERLARKRERVKDEAAKRSVE